MGPKITRRRISVHGKVLPKVKVLGVHEDSESLSYYKNILEGLGLKVLTASTYAVGLACLERETLGFIVVSEGASTFEGRCILERANKMANRTPALVVTRRLDFSSNLEARRLGAVGYRQHPVAAPHMLHLVTGHFLSHATEA